MFLLSSRLDTGSLGHQINNWKIIFLLPHKIDSLQNDVSLLDSPPRERLDCRTVVQRTGSGLQKSLSARWVEISPALGLGAPTIVII